MPGRTAHRKPGSAPLAPPFFSKTFYPVLWVPVEGGLFSSTVSGMRSSPCLFFFPIIVTAERCGLQVLLIDGLLSCNSRRVNDDRPFLCFSGRLRCPFASFYLLNLQLLPLKGKVGSPVDSTSKKAPSPRSRTLSHFFFHAHFPPRLQLFLKSIFSGPAFTKRSLFRDLHP